MNKRFSFTLVLLFLVCVCFIYAGGQGESKSTGKDQSMDINPGGIEWNKPVSMVERIDGNRYVLPEGWKEATAGIKEIAFYNSGGVQYDIATAINMKRFEELTGIKVKAIPLAGELMYAKALSILVSGDGSVALIGVGGPDTDLMPYAGGNWLLPLDVLYPPEVENLYSPALKDLYYTLGHWYASPIATLGTGGFYYRKSWLEKAGVAEPKNWTEFVEASKKMRKWTKENIGEDVYGAVYPGLNINFQYVLQQLTAAQGEKWRKDGKWSFNTPEFKNAFELVVEMIKEDTASQECLNYSLWDAGRLFGLGKSAFVFGLVTSFTSQYMTQYPEVAGDFKFVAPLRWEKNDPDSYQAGILTANSLAITKAASPEQQAAGLLFIDFIRSKEARKYEAVVELNETFYTSIYKEDNPGDTLDWDLVVKTAKELEINPPEKSVDLLEAKARGILVEYAQTNVFPPGYWEIFNKVVEMYGKAVLGESSIDEAIESIQGFADTF